MAPEPVGVAVERVVKTPAVDCKADHPSKDAPKQGPDAELNGLIETDLVSVESC